MHQFVTVGKWSYAAGLSGLNRDVPPFLVVSGHYPMRVRSVNRRGLRRAGLDEQQEEQVLEAFKRLYKDDEGVPLLEVARQMAKEDGLDENVRAMVDAIINSSKHRYGRYLETFRD
jgi:UDP-N-acetylglucosamine acyltransferase